MWILPHWSSETTSLRNILPPAAALNVLVAVIAPTEATSRTNHKAVGKPNGRGPKIVQKSRKNIYYIWFVMERDVWSVGQLAFSRKALLFWKRSQLGLGGHSENSRSKTIQRGAPLEWSAANVSIVSESWSPIQVTESCLYGSGREQPFETVICNFPSEKLKKQEMVQLMSSMTMSFSMSFSICFHVFRTLARRWKRRLRTKNLRAADWILTASRVRSLGGLLSVKLQPFGYRFKLREKHRGRMRKDEEGWGRMLETKWMVETSMPQNAITWCLILYKSQQRCSVRLKHSVNDFLAKLVTRWNFWQRSRWPRQMRWMVVAALINRTEQVRMKV